VACFASAIAAVEPGRLVRAALSSLTGNDPFTHLIAVGKAAPAMAEAAGQVLHPPGTDWHGALVIGEAETPVPTGLPFEPGDHPVPGERSFRAAAALERLVASTGAGNRILFLLSGGTSSLLGAPVAGLAPASLQRIFRTLLASGLDIHVSNRIRKRFLRWGAGRLARALEHTAITALAISDVPGDDPSTIGSGPVSPDDATAGELLALSKSHDLDLPDDAGALLREAARNPLLETPKPGDPCFAGVDHHLIGSNATAVHAALAAARALGYRSAPGPALSGEAGQAGARFAQQVLTSLQPRTALASGGETTVTLGSVSGRGGRNQEFALAAARVLRGIPDVVLLAAGSDGHDGNSSAAGALVDGTTWDRITGPDSRLQRHDSGTALGEADVLLETGRTGTNVMDLVIALRR
jgi:glycerate-2-kinase